MFNQFGLPMSLSYSNGLPAEQEDLVAAIRRQQQLLLQQQQQLLLLSQPVPPPLSLFQHSAAPTNQTMLRLAEQQQFMDKGLSTGRVISKIQTVASERSSMQLSADVKTPQEASKVLMILGTTLRAKNDTFIDASALPYPKVPPSVRGGLSSFYPDKLYRMLEDVAENGQDDIVSFLPHGRAFDVHKMDEFVKAVLPKYFNGQTKWGSFSRQLNLYGFLRVATGNDAGSYYHELFLKGCPNLCRYMRRVGAPSGVDRRRYKLPEGEDPDFYAMPKVRTEKEKHEQESK